jgi:hypothetical protein
MQIQVQVIHKLTCGQPCQVPNLPGLWDEILSQNPSVMENNWMQAHHFMCHPSFWPPLYSLMFIPPNDMMAPWGICTQWSERELTSLLMAMWPSQEALWHLIQTHLFAHVWCQIHFMALTLLGSTAKSQMISSRCSWISGTLQSTPEIQEHLEHLEEIIWDFADASHLCKCSACPL